ncbi:MAG: Threonine synthase [uncultured Thermomicrobiales bacterium]|uniref:Threonine synthase n=1 Tax=uncultured Thermomicrobiales bacterium TaxID=1645740 RepID=A0A6J4VFE7_9BACT|nr:MAG: Threonine synthase [uncultured Thermomicrobiales bacterium]
MGAAERVAVGGPTAILGGALAGIEVRCMACGAVSPGDRPLTACPVCGGLLDVVVPIAGPIDPAVFGRGLPGPLARSGVWRFRPLLPAIPDEAIVSRWEGNTPLYRDDRLAAWAGLDAGAVRVKHEGHNPTASFKDRGMTVGVSHAKAVGARIVACASTGNTSASLASYAAAAGMPSLVLVPDAKISGGKLSQTIAYGAKVVQVAGDFDVALALLRQLTAAWDVYLVNSVNPFRLEGQKTIVFETLEQLAWQPPDYLVLPGGNLGNTAAFGKALRELFEAELIDRVPKLVVVQAAGAAPFAAYWDGGWERFAAVQAETVATAIKIGNPASTARARRSVEFTGGLVTSVGDDEIMDAKAEIDRVGIGCEPASAASLAGLRRLVAAGTIRRDATAVCVLTGHVLKDSDAVAAYHLDDHAGLPRPGANRPLRVAADLPSLERALADALHG